MLKEFIERVKESLGGNVQKLYPDASVAHEVIKEYNGTRRVSSKESFCYAPGINMLFAQNGKVKACCHNSEFILGEYPKQSIAEIWKGKAAEELRGYMKNYDLKHGCDICAADMNSRSYEEVRARHFDSLPRNTEYPTMMEFLLTNTCNLECVMCQGECSSLIRKNRDKLPALVSPYDKDFIKQLEEFIPYLHETRFSGSGEAFAIDANYEIWEMIIRLNPKCIIMVQTNGSYLNERIKNLLARGNFRIGVSIDSLHKETYEAIRLNAKFDRVMENIHYFSEYSRNKNEKFAVALCVMRQNWHELPAFIHFSNANNAVATLHKVWWPTEFAINNLTEIELTAIYTYLSGFDLPANSKLEKKNKLHYQYMVSVIKGWMEEKYVPITNGSTALGLLSEAQLFEYFRSGIEKYLSSTRLSEQIQLKTIEASMKHVQKMLAGYIEKIRSADQMNELQLFDYLQKRMESYLKFNEVELQDIQPVVELCMKKMRMGFEQYGNDMARVEALRAACHVPVGHLVNSLRTGEVEQLVEQSKVIMD